MLSTTESLTVPPSKDRSCESRSWSRCVSFARERSTGVASSKKVSFLGWFVLRARMDELGLKVLEDPVGVAGRGSCWAKSCMVGAAYGIDVCVVQLSAIRRWGILYTRTGPAEGGMQAIETTAVTTGSTRRCSQTVQLDAWREDARARRSQLAGKGPTSRGTMLVQTKVGA
jgi:hypothetical protein